MRDIQDTLKHARDHLPVLLQFAYFMELLYLRPYLSSEELVQLERPIKK